MTSPAIKVATIPMMAMDKGDWFPVSFSSPLTGVNSTAVVIELAVPVVVGLSVAVDLSSWAGAVRASVKVGLGLGTGVFVAVGVMEGVDVNRDVAVGGIVAGGVNVIKGAAPSNIDKFILAVAFSGSRASARFNKARIGDACSSGICPMA
jgi:hypothetical protein